MSIELCVAEIEVTKVVESRDWNRFLQAVNQGLKSAVRDHAVESGGFALAPKGGRARVKTTRLSPAPPILKEGL